MALERLAEIIARLPDEVLLARAKSALGEEASAVLKADLASVVADVSRDEGRDVTLVEMLLRPTWAQLKLRALRDDDGQWAAVGAVEALLRSAGLERDMEPGRASTNRRFGRAHTEWARGTPERLEVAVGAWGSESGPPWYWVYMLEDTTTRMKYVGHTSHHPLLRYMAHFGSMTSQLVKERIERMGPAWNMRLYVLGRARSMHAAKAAEAFFMEYYDTLDRRGLNKGRENKKAALALIQGDFELIGREADTAPVHVYLNGRRSTRELERSFATEYGLGYRGECRGAYRLAPQRYSTGSALTYEEVDEMLRGAKGLPSVGQTVMADYERDGLSEGAFERALYLSGSE